MSKKIWCNSKDVEGHQNFVMGICPYGIGIVIYFCEVFQCYVFPQCRNIYMKKFFQAHYYFLGSTVKLVY